MNMEASRWWLHLAKAGDLKVVVGCAGIAERERDWIGSSAGGSGRRGRTESRPTQGRTIRGGSCCIVVLYVLYCIVVLIRVVLLLNRPPTPVGRNPGHQRPESRVPRSHRSQR